MTDKARFSPRQYEAFRNVYDSYHGMDYAELRNLADKKYNDTKHPRDDIQIGVDVFYDDKKSGNIRCTVALFMVETNQRWWKFWDTAVYSEDFIIKPNGNFIGE